MIDLRLKTNGNIGVDSFFSDVFAAALKVGYNGVIALKTDTGEEAVAFQSGNPISVTGSLLPGDRIGDILAEHAVLSDGALESALIAQEQQGQDRQLLGAILVSAGDTPEQTIQEAVPLQISRRLQKLFGFTSGKWITSAHIPERVRQAGIAVDGWAILLPSIKSGASEEELREVGDRLLGNAVKLIGALGDFDRLFADELGQRILKYLEKPRKVHQIELAIGDRRSVRVMLKALSGLGALELLPAKAGMPIKEAQSRLRPQSAGGRANDPPAPEPIMPAEPLNPVQRIMQRAASKAGQPVGPPKEVVAEIRKLHDALGKQNHFELIGVPQDVDDKALRAKFTAMAKKFHPDSLGPNVPEEIMVMARSISSALNEAHATLLDPERRQTYLAQLKSVGAKGSAPVVANPAGAKVKYEMALVMVKKSDYARARDLLQTAVELDPSQGKYLAMLGWCWFTDNKVDRETGIQTAFDMLTQATEITKADSQIWYFFGRVQKDRGALREAKNYYERALALNPRNADAARELRLMEMRDEKKGDDKKKGSDKKGGKSSGFGALSKLFKR